VTETLRYVLFYESGDLSLAVENFPAHQARYTEFMRRGVLLSLGPFTDRSGSIAVFTTREAAEEFVSGDPFVLHGVVSKWLVREWHEVTPLLVLRQDSLHRGVGRGLAQVVGEHPAGIRDDPDVQHLAGVAVLPCGRVAAAA
jgi:uncharacterized protein